MISNTEIKGFVKETFRISFNTPIEVKPLSKRGSDRKFYRVSFGHNNKAIFIHYDPVRVENTYYADIALFLKAIDVCVPQIYRHDPVRHYILVEDLGDIDLWSLRDEPWDIKKGLYEKTLLNIINLHCFSLSDFPHGKVKMMDGFNETLYRWEHSYFIENFLNVFCRFDYKIINEEKMKKELNTLIEKLLNVENCLIHRDLQSQNVLVKDYVTYIIDFQGMRIGNPLYDLGSLLNDPYVNLSEVERKYLLEFYYCNAKIKLNFDKYEELFWCASIQRLMQALGAYGFLGLKKGLTSFFQFIPPGVENLKNAMAHINFMPYLNKIVETYYKHSNVKEVQNGRIHSDIHNIR